MKNLVLFVVWLAAADTAVVVSNEVFDVADGHEVADVNVNELPDTVVTDVAGLNDETEQPAQTAVATRRDLNEGSIGSSDRLVFDCDFRAKDIKGRVQEKDIKIHTNGRITAIRVTREGNSQIATPSILSGGVGSSSIVIRIRSAIGHGYHYRIQVYARF